MAVSKRLRFEILRRDNHTCRYCGLIAPDVALRVDHVTPVALGGSDDPTNLVASCEPCNSGKSSIAPGSPLVDDVAADALRWAAAMRVAAERYAVDRANRYDVRDYFQEKWNEWGYGSPRRTMDLPLDWPATIDRFISNGLDPDDVIEAVQIAMRMGTVRVGDKWKYFCGVAWRMVRARQDMALTIVRGQEF